MRVLKALKRLLKARQRGTKPGGAAGVAQAKGQSPAPDAEARAKPLYEAALDHLARGEADAAARLLEEVLELRHDFAEAHLRLGQIHHGGGRLEDALDCYVLAVHFQDDLPVAHLQLGLLALDRGLFSEAQGHLERAIALDPGNATAHNALGAALLKLGRTDVAETSLRHALELQPGHAQAHSNLGYLLFREREQFADGTRHIEAALALAPEDEAILCNWSMVLQQQGKFDDMLALSERLLAANPALHEVRLNRALVLLTRGEFESGWKDYEARRRLPPFSQGARRWPEWDGGSLAGRSILVYAEQGLGDEIMFASCLPDVMREARACVVECAPRLQSLFQRSFPAARVVASDGRGVVGSVGSAQAGIDCCTPAGSLPRRWRNTLSDFPDHAGYLVADRTRVAHWRERLTSLGAGLKIGVSWRGGVHSTRRSLRSVPLDQWLPILRCRGAQFVSLQYSDVRGELSDLRARYGMVVHHWQEAIDDLDEMAALIASLDLVVTVQTAVAHLSGALGNEAWVMIPTVPEWRYRVHGDAMPWYPALRLFRQQSPGDWAPLVNSIAARLDARVAGTPARAAGSGSS